MGGGRPGCWTGTSLSNGDTREQLIQLLGIPDGKLEMTGNDPGLLLVTGGVAGQLEDLSGNDGGHVDGGTGSNTLNVVALPQQMVDWRGLYFVIVY